MQFADLVVTDEVEVFEAMVPEENRGEWLAERGWRLLDKETPRTKPYGWTPTVVLNQKP